MLLTPFPDSTGKYIGSAGDTIHYRDALGAKPGFDIQFAGRTIRGVWDVRLGPRVDGFLASYIYYLLDNTGELFADDPAELISRRVQLASAAQRLLPHHKYREYFVAFECRALLAKENAEDEGKGGYGGVVSCLDRYLHDFPHGREHDDLEWLRCQLASSVYEFEGDASLVLGQANAFRLFLQVHPRTHARTDVEFAVAGLYVMASELVAKKDASTYRALADKMYATLVRHPLPRVSARATVALFNLRQGRRANGIPNSY